jgi:lipopolysaccharide biosynthesis glycosyltransferase
LRRHASIALEVHPLSLAELRAARLYRRVHQERDGRLWDVISNAPMSTEFTLTRFLVPHLARYQGWAIYCDCDFLWRADVAELMCFADPQYACMVVKHRYLPQQGEKMRGQWNVIYQRKNWSSLILWNCAHAQNMRLTPRAVNERHRDELHGFFWLHDWQIGALPFEWNWLELAPKAVHFTSGTPDLPGYEDAAYAEEYRSYL